MDKVIFQTRGYLQKIVNQKYFLGKNYLGQADKIHQEITGKDGKPLFKDPESEMRKRGIPVPAIGIEDAKDAD